MRPSLTKSRLEDAYNTLCDECNLPQLPHAELKQLSHETLRHLIKWLQHQKKHADDPNPPAFDETPPGGWDAFRKRAPKEDTGRRDPTHNFNPRKGLTFRQRAARIRSIREGATENVLSIEEDYIDQ